jgi:hypothetical protein
MNAMAIAAPRTCRFPHSLPANEPTRGSLIKADLSPTARPGSLGAPVESYPGGRGPCRAFSSLRIEHEMNPRNQPITLLSGLPESGVSLLRSRLEDAGVRFVPGAGVASCGEGWNWLNDVGDRCAIVHWQRLESLPIEHRYRLVFLRRNLGEVVVSRLTKLAKRGVDPLPGADRLLHRYQRAFRDLCIWLDGSPNVTVLHINYADLMGDTDAIAHQARDFISASDINLLQAMTREE